MDKQLKVHIASALAYSLFILLFYQDYYFNLLMIFIQAICFFLLFLKGRFAEYLAFYLIFSSLSLEFEYMSGTFYGWKSIRFMGISVAVWLLMPLFLIALTRSVSKKWAAKNKVNRLAGCFILLNMTAVLMGIVMLCVNDNNIMAQEGAVYQFFLTVYENLTRIFVPVVTFSFFLNEDNNAREVVKKAVIAVLIGLTCQEIASLCTGIMGKMWLDSVLLVGPVQTFAPFLLLFILFKNDYVKWCSLILGAAACFMALKFSYGSGQFIILFSVPVWFGLIVLERKKIKEYRVFMILGMIIAPMVVMAGAAIQYGDSIKFKLDQALSAFQIWKPDWLDNLPVSVRFRVEEVKAIVTEYMEKPYYMLLGKGYMGTFKDTSMYFQTSSEAGSVHAFSLFEWDMRAFYSVHESFNKLLLTNGIVGVLVFFKVVIQGIKNAVKSPFIAIGVMWFCWYWGFSTTYSYFGIACLFLGFADIEHCARHGK